MIQRMPFNHLRSGVKTILANDNESAELRMTKLCELLQISIGYYDWVGFYFSNHETQTLHLKAFAGEPTDHVEIPFGKGICGQVAVSNNNFIVADVKTQNNYIACSMRVKAEIVVPLFKDGVNIGQIDVDSHTADPFSSEDERFLEFVCERLAKII
jgi:L-methionine (R)-S-oxide reductase